MDVFISEAAQERLGERLAALAPDASLRVLGRDGVFRIDGATADPAEVDAEAWYVSLDLFADGRLGLVFPRMLAGRGGGFAQLFNAGLDNPAFARLAARGLRLAKSSAQAPPIAEYVLAHALARLHPVAAQALAQAERRWERTPFREIARTRWLIVGFGAIGREIARRIQPFGAAVTAVRRSPEPDPLADEVRPPGELMEAAREADVIVLACPLTSETRGLAGEAFFSALKPDALLINIARGGLVDEAALKRALDEGRLGGAVLDVAGTEPAPPDSWLWSHPRVVLTAHTSNAGDGVIGRCDELFLENLVRYRGGQRLRNEASPEEAGAAA